MEWNKDYCDERHEEDRRRLDNLDAPGGEVAKLHGRVDSVIEAVNGKFTKLFYFFLTTLITSIGGTITIIVLLVKSGARP